MRAWVIAVSMGYGHQRTAHPLRDLSPDGEVLLANDYPGMPADDRAVWERTRRFYEFISNVQRVPVVGEAAFGAFDLLQRILHFYPRRDLSRADWNSRFLCSLIRDGWGRHLVEWLAGQKPVLPIVTSFFTPAFMAEHFDYPGDIYCAICDTDVARVWAARRPAKSRIRYFAPTERVAERLGLYGVDPGRVFVTGYPLPEENIGGRSLGVLKGDLARRLVRLDPNGRFLSHYGAVVAERLGRLPERDSKPLTVVFSIGGAGAQKEIGAAVARSLRHRIARGQVRLVLSAGIKPWVRDYMAGEVGKLGLAGATGSGAGVDILFAETISEYFGRFNLTLRTADILWTKPSELVFYSALGVPIIMAPPLGSQERANREWLERLGAGLPQDDPRYAGEWLFDLIESGALAEAAMEGFVEGTAFGTQAIRDAITTASTPENGGEAL